MTSGHTSHPPSHFRYRSSTRPRPSQETLIDPSNIGLNDLAAAQRAGGKKKTTWAPGLNRKRRNSHRKTQASSRDPRRGRCRERFQVSSSGSFPRAETPFARCGYDASEERSATKSRDRERPLEHLRGIGPRRPREVMLALELVDLPEHQPCRKSANGPAYEEIRTTARLKNWEVDLGLPAQGQAGPGRA